MKIGVLTFGYANFPYGQQLMAQQGHYTVNLGDNAQTIAARSLLARLGATAEDVVSIDRDRLGEYDGPPVAVLMNAAFRSQCFPVAPQIRPIFLGFWTRPETMRENADYLRAHAPIGCRDIVTAAQLNDMGIEAFVTGCVTLTLEPRQSPDAGHVYIVYGSGAGELPPTLLGHIPSELLNHARLVFHRLPVFEQPLSIETQSRAEHYEGHFMAELEREARLVITSLHHVAAPAMAKGIPTIICRVDRDTRFSLLETLTPIHVPGEFEGVNWNPAAADIEPYRTDYISRLAEILRSLDGL